jgi:formate hydrogenlyase subunit 6/NADH:ubiquinone oxidoreductase subunit I
LKKNEVLNMSFPKISRSISKDIEHVKVQFLTESLELILDRTKCVGCGTCARVCPKEAISRGPVAAARRFPNMEDIIPEIYDPKLCVFCGTCVYMCPFSALTLKKDGEVIELEDIQIVKENVVPKLEFEAKKITDNASIKRVVKQYAEGELSVVDEECSGGCEACADVCPSAAITVPEKSDKGWETVPNVVVDEKECVFCGSCDNACPTGAIKLKITDIKTSGEFSELFWEPLIERIKTLRWSEKKEE